jgi:hypothetical protein
MTGDETTQGRAGAREPGGGDDGSPTAVHLATPAVEEEYLAGVRPALSDLPAPEVAEILDDVRAHLTDLTAELGGDAGVAALTARLGPPSAYAAELRAAAGYPLAPEPTRRERYGTARLAAAGLVVDVVDSAGGRRRGAGHRPVRPVPGRARAAPDRAGRARRAERGGAAGGAERCRPPPGPLVVALPSTTAPGAPSPAPTDVAPPPAPGPLFTSPAAPTPPVEPTPPVPPAPVNPTTR